jgi:hypothetical protein
MSALSGQWGNERRRCGGSPAPDNDIYMQRPMLYLLWEIPVRIFPELTPQVKESSGGAFI